MRHTSTQTLGGAITLTLVEPYPLARASIRELVSAAPDLRIVAEVATIDDAIALGRGEPTDVVLVDLAVPLAFLVPALQQLRRECPLSALIVIGQRSDDELFHAIEAGAAAHVVDAVRLSELVTTIRAVAAGEYVIDASVAARPEVARRVLEAFPTAVLNGEASNDLRQLPGLARLSARETKILMMASEGMSNRDIAAALSISTRAVGNSVKAVLRKLAVNNRTQAVLVALRESWIPLPEGPSNRAH